THERGQHHVGDGEEELEQRRHPRRRVHLEEERDRGDEQRVVRERRKELRRNDRVEPALHPPGPVVAAPGCRRLDRPGAPGPSRGAGRLYHERLAVPSGGFPTPRHVYSSAMPRPIQATIHPAALAGNLARARAAAPGARVWAVVKADGYGHGLLRAAAAFEEADGLALLEFDRAGLLRERYPDRRILMLEGPFDPADALQAVRERLDLVVHSAVQLDWLEEAVRAAGAAPPAVWLKFDSGMHRLGFDPSGLAAARARLEAIEGLPIGLASHFANADRSGGIEPALGRLRELMPWDAGPCSFANSAALLASPVTHADWVRPGIMLYGGSPFDARSAASLGLRAGMTLSSEVIAVRGL